MSNNPPRIGYLTCEVDGNYQRTIWQGVEAAVKENGVNVINFVGGVLDAPQDLPRNVIYDLVDTKALNGLIVLTVSDLQGNIGPL